MRTCLWRRAILLVLGSVAVVSSYLCFRKTDSFQIWNPHQLTGALSENAYLHMIYCTPDDDTETYVILVVAYPFHEIHGPDLNYGNALFLTVPTGKSILPAVFSPPEDTFALKAHGRAYQYHLSHGRIFLIDEGGMVQLQTGTDLDELVRSFFHPDDPREWQPDAFALLLRKRYPEVETFCETKRTPPDDPEVKGLLRELIETKCDGSSQR